MIHPDAQHAHDGDVCGDDGDAANRATHPNTGVVDKDINAMVMELHLLDEPGQAVRIAHIQRKRLHLDVTPCCRSDSLGRAAQIGGSGQRHVGVEATDGERGSVEVFVCWPTLMRHSIRTFGT